MTPLRIRMNMAHDLRNTGDTDRAALANQVESLLARLNPSVSTERRRDERFPISVLFCLTPLDADRQPIESEAAIVVGKNISRRGLSFYHERPSAHRRAIVTLAQPGLGNFAAEIDVTWCRFRRPGWYESGGRLVRSIQPIGDVSLRPLEQAELSQLAGFLSGQSTDAGG